MKNLIFILFIFSTQIALSLQLKSTMKTQTTLNVEPNGEKCLGIDFSEELDYFNNPVNNVDLEFPAEQADGEAKAKAGDVASPRNPDDSASAQTSQSGAVVSNEANSKTNSIIEPTSDGHLTEIEQLIQEMNVIQEGASQPTNVTSTEDSNDKATQDVSVDLVKQEDPVVATPVVEQKQTETTVADQTKTSTPVQAEATVSEQTVVQTSSQEVVELPSQKVVSVQNEQLNNDGKGEMVKEEHKEIIREEVAVSKEAVNNELSKEIVADIDNEEEVVAKDEVAEVDAEKQEQLDIASFEESAENTYAEIVKKLIGKNLKELEEEKVKITNTITSAQDLQAKLKKLIDMEIHKGPSKDPKALADYKTKYQKSIDTEEELQAEIIMLDDLISTKKAEEEGTNSADLESFVNDSFDESFYTELQDNGLDLSQDEKQVFDQRFNDINKKKNKIVNLSSQLGDSDEQQVYLEEDGEEEEDADVQYDDKGYPEEDYSEADYADGDSYPEEEDYQDEYPEDEEYPEEEYTNEEYSDDYYPQDEEDFPDEYDEDYIPEEDGECHGPQCHGGECHGDECGEDNYDDVPLDEYNDSDENYETLEDAYSQEYADYSECDDDQLDFDEEDMGFLEYNY
jgi:hypothetical protein